MVDRRSVSPYFLRLRILAAALAAGAALGGLAAPRAWAQPGCLPVPQALDTTSHQVGRLTSMGNGLARATYQYDALGRAMRTAYALDGTSWVFSDSYGYPQNPGTTLGPGTVVRARTFPDGEVVSYGFDTSGQRQTLTATRPGQAAQPIVTTMLRNAREQTTQVSFGNGAISTRAYNDATDLRLREIATTFGGGTVQRLTYAFDPNGNTTGVTDGVVAGYSASYAYDSLDQLTTMGGSVTGSYSYDPLGNLVSKDGVLQTYGGAGRGPHALAAAGPAVYSYDENGNVVSTSTGLALTWNADNLAIRATQGGVEKNRKSFVGERLWKKVEGGVTTYYMPALLVENGACRKVYDDFAERSPDGTLEYYHPDHLGSSTVATSATQVSHRIAYLPWGEDRGVAGGSFVPRFQFNFKEKESTGLYDYGARLYNPATGRFLSPDTLTGDGLNRYAYVRNNPLSRVDPSGNLSFPAITQMVINIYPYLLIDYLARNHGTLGVFVGGWRNTTHPPAEWMQRAARAMHVSAVVFLANHNHFFPQVFFGMKDKQQAEYARRLIEYAAKRGVDTVIATFSSGVNAASSALQHATMKRVVFAIVMEPNTASESTMRGVFDNVRGGFGIVQDTILDPKNVLPFGSLGGQMYGILPHSQYPNVRIDLWGKPGHSRQVSLGELGEKQFLVPQPAWDLDLMRIEPKTLTPNQ